MQWCWEKWMTCQLAQTGYLIYDCNADQTRIGVESGLRKYPWSSGIFCTVFFAACLIFSERALLWTRMDSIVAGKLYLARIAWCVVESKRDAAWPTWFYRRLDAAALSEAGRWRQSHFSLPEHTKHLILDESHPAFQPTLTLIPVVMPLLFR